jgi:hypothetical protein
LVLTFFGLTPKLALDFRASVFSQIHEVVFHGKGGYDWETVYNMPIWLRNFTFKKIKSYYEEEAQQLKNKSQSTNSQNILDSSGKIKPPQFQNKTSYK